MVPRHMIQANYDTATRKAGVKGMLEKTLAQQHNCFLPNYKRPNMMRHQGHFSQFIEPVTPTLEKKPLSQKRHSRKRTAGTRRMEFVVANSSGLIVPINADKTSIALADLEPFISEQQESRVIKI